MKEDNSTAGAVSAGTGNAAVSYSTWRVVFSSVEAAEKYLAERGFSVGRRQGPTERGVLLGDYDIQKWRNLSPADRTALHGVLGSSGRNGWAAVTIYGAAGREAHEAIRGPASKAAPVDEAGPRAARLTRRFAVQPAKRRLSMKSRNRASL